MLAAPVLLGCVLAVQLPPVSGSSTPEFSPPAMVAEQIKLSPDGSPPGEPIHLAEAMAGAVEGTAQAQIAHAYWHLAGAVAAYNARRGEMADLAALSPGAGDEAALATARAEAAARAAEAELAVIAAQHDLAVLAERDLAGPLPLPADPPHVGTYRTGFDEVFAARPAPPESRRIDRRLPVHRRVIQERASAVRWAWTAWQAALERYRAGRGDLGRCLAAADRLADQREAFFASVCQYNHDIADYVALAVERPLGPAVFVSRLIETPEVPATPLVATRPDAGLPWQQPTLAPPRGDVRQVADLQPAEAGPPRATATPWVGREESLPPATSPSTAAAPTTRPWEPGLIPPEQESQPARPVPASSEAPKLPVIPLDAP